MSRQVPDIRQLLQERRARRQARYELEENQRWVHHAVDLERGGIVTTLRDRPPTPVFRADRLAAIGQPVDPGIFHGPSYKLDASQPYLPGPPQASLEAATASTYAAAAGGDVVAFDPPSDFDGRSPFIGMIFDFAMAPWGRALATLALVGSSYDGTAGNVYLSATWTQTEVWVPVDSSFGMHTVDFTFGPPQGTDAAEIVMACDAGIQHLEFHALTLASAPPVLAP